MRSNDIRSASSLCSSRHPCLAANFATISNGSFARHSFGEDFTSHKEVLSIEGAHVATVKKVAWRPGGEEMVLASCGMDHAVKVNKIITT